MKRMFTIIIFFLFLITACTTEEIKREETSEETQQKCVDRDTSEIQKGYGAHNEDFRQKGTVTAAYFHSKSGGAITDFGERTDFCQTLEEAPEQEPFLIEFECTSDNKYARSSRLLCSDFVGEGYICQDGACVRRNGQETYPKADCGGPYAPVVGIPFTFDGSKSFGDIVYYEVSFSDGVENNKEVTGASEILIEHTFEEARATNDYIRLMVQDNTGTKDYCQIFFTVSSK